MENEFINHFQHPWMLLALPLPFLLLAWHAYRTRRRPAVLYSDLSIARGLPVSLRQRCLSIFPWVRTFALCLGIIALARPQYGTVQYDSQSIGVDIALAIDVSGSMQEQDYNPTRLEAAKTAAINFVQGRETDRVTVVIFGTNAALLTPPTLDMNAVETFIDAIHPNIIQNQSTAIGDGLGMAVKKLEDSPAESRVAILLTDGENNSGELEPLRAAEIAKALGVRVYTIGVTSRPARGLGGLAMGRGSVNEGVLQNIAEMTDGRFFQATDEESLQEIYNEIDRMEQSEIEVDQTTDYDERFMFFWFPGLALLGLEFFLRAFWVRRLP